LQNRPQPRKPVRQTQHSAFYQTANLNSELRAPVRPRSRLEEYAPVVFGGLLLVGAFAFAGHYLGRNAVAHNSEAFIASVEKSSRQGEATPVANVTKGSLLPEGETFEILDTKILDAQVIDVAGKSDFVIEDPIGLEEIENPPAPKLVTKPLKKLAEKPVKKLKIEPASIDLQEEAKLEKPMKKVALSPVVLVKPGKIAKVPAPTKDATQTKAEKQKVVAQRRIRLAEENCLARAIYFEARGETEMGQLAVAKVVINRTKNPNYPKTICGVVYQGSQRRNSCQFSFACDGYADDIKQPASWAQSKRIAKKALDGDHSLKSMNATNYHADYVKPKWSKTLRRIGKIGRHIFYHGG
jgi:spore germination cell wall hydrolase CwlJ-like protein